MFVIKVRVKYGKTIIINKQRLIVQAKIPANKFSAAAGNTLKCAIPHFKFRGREMTEVSKVSYYGKKVNKR